MNETWIKKLIEKYPSNAIDIAESLELAKDAVDEAILSIREDMYKMAGERRFDDISELNTLAQQLHEYEIELNQQIAALDVEVFTSGDADDEPIEVERAQIPNYAAYTVNQDVEYSLVEDFKHKRPHAFKINDKRMVEVQTWKEMLLKTSELLCAVDSEKWAGFEHDAKMNGKRKKVFSADRGQLRKPEKIGDLYIETNRSANDIRNLLIKLLRAYDYKMNDFKIYLRADYTDLHS